MAKWLAITVGIVSLAVAFQLHGQWGYGAVPAHAIAGWVLAAILAAQMTALFLRKWRLSLVAAVLAVVLLFIDAQWLGLDCSKGCEFVLQEAT